MTALDLAAWKALEAKATKGPWTKGWGPGITGPGAAWRFGLLEASDPNLHYQAARKEILVTCPSSLSPDSHELVAILPVDPDADFIAHARTVAPQAIQVIEALCEALDRALEELHFNHGCDPQCEVSYHAALALVRR